MQDFNRILARLDELSDECFPCCFSFFLNGRGKDVRFLRQVLDHYEQTRDVGNQIKDSILFILDEPMFKGAAFADETRALIESITGEKLNSQENAPLLKKKERLLGE